MSLGLSWTIARRELRGGLSGKLQGFRVFIACLALGVAAIAAVTSVRESISSGLIREGATLLGGDAELEFTYRFATDTERAWLDTNTLAVSEITDFRSMITFDDERALTQVKTVDDMYPLRGAVKLAPPMLLSEALDGTAGIPGAVLDPVLLERLGLSLGDHITVGDTPFVVMAELLLEPDGAGSGFALGPRSIVRTSALKGSNLLSAGTLFETSYRVLLPEGVNLDTARDDTKAGLQDSAYRWRDSRNGAPRVSRFIERLGTFLVLVGLAGLAVGGVGVSAAVQAYLNKKTTVIATLKTLGADRQTILGVYAIQIGILAGISIVLGLIIGAALPVLAAPLIEARLPIPIEIGIYPSSLLEAAVYGSLASALFVLWPLARAEKIRPAALYREAHFGLRGVPRLPYLLALAGCVGLLVLAAVMFTDSRRLVFGAFAGVIGAFIILALAAWIVRLCAKWLSRRNFTKGRPALRLAFGSVGGPSEETSSVILSLGLGLTVLSAVGQIDSNLRNAIATDLPDVAPSYFVVDIQKDQIDGFAEIVNADPGVSRFESAPMLRGVITKINGQDANEVAGDHWVIRGDRGITYSNTQPDNAKVTAGNWWPKDYTGEPQISFAAEEAEEIGLSLGDTMTVNILGRDFTARITSFREVDFSGAGLGFILSMNENALIAAPHTHIATIYAQEDAEGPLIRELSKTYPNITTIKVRDAIERVVSIMQSIAAATTLGALATLITGAVVLIGAAAAGEEKRGYEAAILKTLGASRARVLGSFALRSLILGVAAGCVAIFAGGLAGWAVTHFVMEADFIFMWATSLWIVFGGIVLTLGTSLAFSWRAMRVRPAQVLRSKD
jgi:putative ABC transport system permease protein